MARGSKFATVPVAVLRDSRITPAMLRVFAELASYADSEGWCFPSMSTMAEHLAVSRQAIAQNIAALERLGIVVSQRRQGPSGANTSNEYRIDWSWGDRPRGMQAELATPMQGELATPPQAGLATRNRPRSELDQGKEKKALRAVPILEGVDDELREWCATECPDVDPSTEFPRWRDHCAAKPDDNPMTPEWFRNWCRTAQQRLNRRRGKPPVPQQSTIDAEQRRADAERQLADLVRRNQPIPWHRLTPLGWKSQQSPTPTALREWLLQNGKPFPAWLDAERVS